MIISKINDVELKFNTNPKNFSPNALDKGTIAMLSVVKFEHDDKVLDLGCGYGFVGIYAAKFVGFENVVMCDISGIAVEISKENAILNDVEGIKILRSEGFKDLDDTNFSIILSNPPYHTDFSIAKHFIEKGFNRLKMGGKLFMVTKRKPWYENKISAVFGGVKVYEIDGYFVFEAEKKNLHYAKSVDEKETKPGLSSKLERKMKRKHKK